MDVEEQIAAAVVAQQNLQWQGAIMTFCFTSSIEIALQFAETPSKVSSSLKLVSSANLITFCLLLVANFINGRFGRVSQLLEKVAIVIAAVTLMFITIAAPFH
ncbi:hypothetical protein DITRI_Ditri15bG0069100 [Diplodiscus trichospermus]